MHDRYDYEPREYADWSGFSDTDPVAEPIIDYSIWPPDPPEPEAARDESLRRLGKLTWRAAQLSAVAAAAFVVLFVRSAPAQTTTSQKVARPAGTLTPAAATPAPSPRPPHHRGRGERTTQRRLPRPARPRRAAVPRPPRPLSRRRPPRLRPARRRPRPRARRAEATPADEGQGDEPLRRTCPGDLPGARHRRLGAGHRARRSATRRARSCAPNWPRSTPRAPGSAMIPSCPG